jgi:hypothetical protein
MIIQRTGALGNQSIEAPDLGDLVGEHCLTLVRYMRPVKEMGSRFTLCLGPLSVS